MKIVKLVAQAAGHNGEEVSTYSTPYSLPPFSTQSTLRGGDADPEDIIVAL